jgi:hypothetical protein
MSHRPAPPDADAVRQAVLDLFVYAPIGFLFEAREVMPKLAERGRSQVTLARLFGHYAIQRGQAEADRIITRNRPAPTAPSDANEAAPPATSPSTSATTTPTPTPTPTPTTTTTTAPRRRRAAATGDAPTETLAIPGYDSLSASQVVPRLDALRPDELDAVRRHEAAHRGRRTILNRIAQLQA